MSAFVISQAIFYAFSTEFSKQTIYITTKKIFELLSFWGAGTSPGGTTSIVVPPTGGLSLDRLGVNNYTIPSISEKGDYYQIIRTFLLENHIQLKLSIAEAIVRERTTGTNGQSLGQNPPSIVEIPTIDHSQEEKTMLENKSKIEEESKLESKLEIKEGGVGGTVGSRYETKAIEIACTALAEVLGKIHKELELLKQTMEEHKQKYFYWIRTPSYEKHLTKIAKLMKVDFEVCFFWLERSINCRKV